MAVEMSSYKVLDFLFGLLMQILELVRCGEFFDIEAIGKNPIRLSLQ